MEDDSILLVEEEAKVYNIRHRCFHFSKDVIKFIQHCKYDKIYFSLFDQLMRSATSIGANIVEGSAGSTKKRFYSFLCNFIKVGK